MALAPGLSPPARRRGRRQRGRPAPLTAAIVLGGYGTFGRLVARGLAQRGFEVTIAGRDGARAAACARELRGPHTGRALDFRDAAALADVLARHDVLVHAAGPYGSEHVNVLKACAAGRCHYVDLAEERRYNALVRGLSGHFEAAGLTAVHGASSLPGISGALALVAAEQLGEAPVRTRVTLWIGNRNVKGAAAIAASLGVAGRPIDATDALTGFGQPERIELPPPIGPVTGRSYDAPEYDLFPAIPGGAVTVKVAFELGFAGPLVSLVARLPGGRSGRMARLLAWTGGLASGFGSSGGAVQVEMWGAGGARRRAALVADSDGQWMAALPAVLAAVRAVQEGAPRGALTAYELLGAQPLLDALGTGGNRLVLD